MSNKKRVFLQDIKSYENTRYEDRPRNYRSISESFAGCTLLGAIHNIFHGFPVFVHDGKVESPGPFAPDLRFPVIKLGALDEVPVFPAFSFTRL